MSEGSSESSIQKFVSIEEKDDAQKPKRDLKVNKSLSNLAKEAEAILKGFGDKDEIPEGRRATRSCTRGSTITPVSTPPPVKRERKSIASGTSIATPSNKRGRPKKLTSEGTKASDGDEKNNVELNDGLNSEKKSDYDEKKSSVKGIDDVEIKSDKDDRVDSLSEETELRNSKEKNSVEKEDTMTILTTPIESPSKENNNPENENNLQNIETEISKENESLEKSKASSAVPRETCKSIEKMSSEEKLIDVTPGHSSSSSTKISDE